jgi:hypothetical protein
VGLILDDLAEAIEGGAHVAFARRTQRCDARHGAPAPKGLDECVVAVAIGDAHV